MTSHRATHRVHGARTAATAAPGTTSYDAARGPAATCRAGDADDWNSTGS